MTTNMQVYEFQLPEAQEVAEKLKAIERFQALVQKSLKIGYDYGTVPGIDKPFLWKPGAEKIAKLMGLSDHYEIIDKLEDWDAGLFSYAVKCQLKDMASGVIISEGIGEANTYESKYRYRWIWPNQAEDMGYSQEERHMLPMRRVGRYNDKVQYRIDNEDRASQKNTVLKMAKKRSMTDASLSAGRLSELFSQDEDVFEGEYKEVKSERTPTNGATREANSKVPLRPPFKDVGQFLMAAKGRWNVNRDKVLEILGLDEAPHIDYETETHWSLLEEELNKAEPEG